MSDTPARPKLVFAMNQGLVPRIFGAEQWVRLQAVADVLSPVSYTDFNTPEAAELLKQAEIIVGAWGAPALDQDLLEKAPNLRLVAYAAASIRAITTPAFWRAGIPITSAVAAMAVPVAEFTYAAIIMTGKDVINIRDINRQQRGAQGFGSRIGLDVSHLGNYGRRIGIVGASRIGRLVIAMLVRSGYAVAVYDPFASPADVEKMGAQAMGLDQLLEWSHTVSLHAPILPETRHMIGARELGLMRDNAVLINTARGWLVDHDALLAELQRGRIRAWIDTPDPEPFPPDSPFYDLPNLVLTPHIAGTMGNELHSLAEAAINEIERFVAGLPPLDPVLEQSLDRIA
ncbi:hydroxyacid dehydrogenase [Devosia sp. BSSL-BM10]|uniref:Hydroxyacid dehydrogenase n=1 Tax=Devosia litorisediminis TaxID=2829817 RepID=A0A942ECA9_9HYPH|nr:hydroxyacid dehydrogenase [Devosia litorisediminis]MBS3848689.1 hydroxyacid dehydrogenase [Devosia litorisediminis]